MIRPLSLEVRAKLGKLLPMLSSPNDGERIGAVAAVERVLKAADLDWHDFTAAITGGLRPPPPPPPPPPSEGESRSVRGEDLRETIAAWRSRRRFDARSEEFLDSMLWRADEFEDVFISQRQWSWLRNLARQAGK